MDVPASPDNRHWLRGLRPLFLWFILFLTLYGIRWHQRMSAQTNVQFTASVPGPSSFIAVSAQLDGRDFANGQRVNVGWHTLSLSHPKGRPFTTNFFVWYGEHDLGALKLERASGTLAITANPPAQAVKIQGPELRKELANVSSDKIAAPTDEYTVTAIYPYFTVEKTVIVGDEQQTFCSFTPAVGVLQADFGYSGAQFELRRMKKSEPGNQILERGKLPTTVMGLEVGQYQLHSTYQGLFANRSFEITANQTNQLEIEFPLGSILIESMPAGATVSDERGNDIGTTPFTLTGVPAGNWRGELNLPDYMPVTFAVNVLAKQTNNFQTNLVRRSFAMAMELLERSRKEVGENIAPVIEAFTIAVKDDPGNMVAVRILKKSRVAQALVNANNKAKSGDFTGALQDGEAALVIMPDDPDMQQLVADFKKTIQGEQAQAEANKQRAAAVLRVSQPRDYFAKLMSRTADSGDFAEQTLKIRGEVGDIRTKIADALSKSLLNKFIIEENSQPFDEGFLIRCKLSQLDGFKRCYLVGGQTTDGEVTLYFKVFEYGWPAEMALTALVSKPSEDQAISINRSTVAPSILEYRRELGIKIVTDRIRSAVGR